MSKLEEFRRLFIESVLLYGGNLSKDNYPSNPRIKVNFNFKKDIFKNLLNLLKFYLLSY